jgi:hypothetical protein
MVWAWLLKRFKVQVYGKGVERLVDSLIPSGNDDGNGSQDYGRRDMKALRDSEGAETSHRAAL